MLRAVQLIDSSNVAFGVDRDGNKPIASMVQYVVADAGNSSIVNIGPGASFVGATSSSLNCGLIQVNLKADQNCDVFIEQSPDTAPGGPHWDVVDSFEYQPGITFGENVKAQESYYRVRITNTSSLATTTFRLQTCLLPVGEALPRSGTPRGNLKAAIREINDALGNEVHATPTHALQVAQPYRLAGVAFRSTADAQFWTLTNSGVASSATVNVLATLVSGTSINGYGQIQSVRMARYIAGVPNRFRALARVPVLVIANNSRRWGAFSTSGATPQNGVYFEVNAAGVLSVNRVKGGAVTTVANGSFNGIKSEYTLDTLYHEYYIVYQIDKVDFVIDDELIHSMALADSALTNDPNVPATATTLNSVAGVTSGTLEILEMEIARLGRPSSESTYVHISTATTTVCRIGSGNLKSIIVGNPANGSITIYDNTVAGGSVIGIPNPGNSSTPFTLDFKDLPFFTGLTIVTSVAMDLTVVFE